jgi:predicted Zn-dependent protease
MKSWKEILIVLAVCALVVVGLNKTPESVGPEDTSAEYEPRLITKDHEPARSSLILVQLDTSPRLAEWCRREIASSTGAEVVEILDLSSEGLLASTKDEGRNQYDADKIIEALAGLPRGADQKILALTEEDLFLSSVPEWRYCYGSHGQNVAVLSSVRMGGRFQEELFPSPRSQHRCRKMLFRYVLEMCYDLNRNSRPESLLYERVLGPRDLDNMEYEI